MGRKKISNSVLVDLFFEYFKECWSNSYGVWFGKFTGRDRTKVKKIIEGVGYYSLKKRLKKYFDDDSEWLKERCHPLNVFLSQVNNYAVEVNNAGKKKSKIAKHRTFDVKEELKKRSNRSHVGTK